MAERIVKSTSFSRASDYEKCKLQFKLKHIDKIPDPAPPLPEGQEYPMERGTRLHTLAENFIKNPMMRLPEELRSLERWLTHFQKLYQKNMVECEQGLGFDENWRQVSPTDWANCRYRMVADVVLRPSDKIICIVDWKSGKKENNEIKHHQQLMEYACCFALIDPDIQLFYPKVGYIDLPEGENTLEKSFTREQVLRAFPRMKKRHEAVLNARIFPAEPSQFACRFCPYKAGMVGRGKKAYPGTGHCRRNVV
jgi:CRISPR/Cas system-associated exonuclease Cas4 (RecB family)